MQTIGNITDDNIEALLAFVRQCAGLLKDGEVTDEGLVHESECDDLLDTLDSLIGQARELLGLPAREFPNDLDTGDDYEELQTP